MISTALNTEHVSIVRATARMAQRKRSSGRDDSTGNGKDIQQQDRHQLEQEQYWLEQRWLQSRRSISSQRGRSNEHSQLLYFSYAADGAH